MHPLVGVQLEYLGNDGLYGCIFMGNRLSGFLYRFLFGGIFIPSLIVFQGLSGIGQLFGPLLLVLPCLLIGCQEAFLPYGIKGLLNVHQDFSRGPFRPDMDAQLHLVGQCQFQHVGAGVYRLLNHILF